MASSSLPVYNVVLSSSSKDADDFSSLLCKSLTSKGIRVLRSEDGQEVEGDTTTTSQELAIQESTRFAIVILSRNYASSPRLLEELSQILERKRVSGISVSPVFYDVKPSDVEQQTGDFGESFNKNVLVFKEDPEKVLRWRIALREVAKLIGWSSEHRNQTKLIKEIVNFVAVRREQPSSLSSLLQADISNREIGVDVNALDDREGTMDATSSAEWNFLLTALVLEIFSAGFDQASSPRKPHYALIGMMLAIAAVLACTWELIHKGSLVLKRWQKLRWFYYLQPSNTLFGSLPDIFGLVSSISQFVFSTVQYIYFSHHVDSPIKLSLLPAIFLMCLAGSMLYRNRRPSCLTNGSV
ncbi:hypothetical protein M0R45_009589 [Rubus argutus]|uniref:TIR domain-containing protein n=1 Tax=Rubus argutus TaxID=59490 RepID=A0AAW1Y4V1_RUBAR